MKGADFIRLVQRHGRTTEVSVRFDARRGKGSHGRLYYGNRFTIVPNPKHELKTGTLHAMLSDLGLKLPDLR